MEEEVEAFEETEEAVAETVEFADELVSEETAEEASVSENEEL